MDYRPYYWLLTIVSALAGGTLGFFEGRDGTTGRGNSTEIPGSSSGPGSAPGLQEQPAPPSPGEVAAAEPADGAETSGAAPARVPEDQASPGAERARRPLDARARRDIERALAREDFATAEWHAESAFKTGGDPEAQRLASLVRVLAVLTPSTATPQETAVPAVVSSAVSPPPAKSAPRRYEVLLANGRSLEALEALEAADRWELRLADGTSFTPRREDVLDLREVAAPAPGVAATPADSSPADSPPAAGDLDARIAGLETPGALYEDGVLALFDAGRREEGQKLLRELVERPESLALLGRLETDDLDLEALEEDWRRAARLDAARPPPPPPPPPRVAERKPAPSASEAAVILRAQKLVAEARLGYREAFGKEGREEELRSAYTRLERARDLLASLGATDDDEVLHLRREIAQLLFDLGRALNF